MGGFRTMRTIAVLAACGVGLGLEMKDAESFQAGMRDCIMKTTEQGYRDEHCRFAGTVGGDRPAVDLTRLTNGSRIPLWFQSDGVLVGLKAAPVQWGYDSAFQTQIATPGYHACAPEQADSWIVRGNASHCTLQWGRNASEDSAEPLYLELHYRLRLENMPVSNYQRRPRIAKDDPSSFCTWRLNGDGTVSPSGQMYPPGLAGRALDKDGVLGLSRAPGQRGTDLILVRRGDPRRLVRVRADPVRGGPGRREYDCPEELPRFEALGVREQLQLTAVAAVFLLSLLCMLWRGSCVACLSGWSRACGSDVRELEQPLHDAAGPARART